MHLNRNRQQGSAIIMALFIMALVAATGVAMMSRFTIDMQRTRSALNDQRMYFISQGATVWAIDVLTENGKISKDNTLTDKTPITSPTDEEASCKIYSILRDAQGYFNVNNLSQKDSIPQFTQLIKSVNPDMELETAMTLAMNAHKWIAGGDDDVSSNRYYEFLSPSYHASHRFMASSSELRLVKGFEPDIFNRLKPFIIALPVTTHININNAEAPVLMSLKEGVSPEAAIAILQKRKQSLFTTLEEFTNFEPVKNNLIPTANLTIRSDYFLLETHISNGQQNRILYTLLWRSIKDKIPSVVVVWQTKGTL